MTESFPWPVAVVLISVIGCMVTGVFIGFATGATTGEAWQIASTICRRILTFAFSGGSLSLFIGAVNGGILGAVLGAIEWAWSRSPVSAGGAPPIPRDLTSTVLSAGLGMVVGAIVAALAGLVVFPIVAILQRARVDVNGAITQAYYGAFRGSLRGSLIGAVLGCVGFTLVGSFVFRQGLAALAFGGIIWGCVGGCTLGFFAGAILGGTGRLEYLSLRALYRWAFQNRL